MSGIVVVLQVKQHITLALFFSQEEFTVLFSTFRLKVSFYWFPEFAKTLRDGRGRSIYGPWNVTRNFNALLTENWSLVAPYSFTVASAQRTKSQ